MDNMMIDMLLDLIKKRRSIRRFKPEAIPEGYIEKILESGRWAMSGANAQPWEFIVVRDEATRKKIVDSWFEPTKEAYIIEQTRLPDMRHHHLRELATSPAFRDAPVLIAVIGDRRTYQATVLGANFLVTEGGSGAIYFKNMANTTQNIHLAAAALGLGSEWISVNRLWAEAIKGILEIPELLDVHTMVAVGYPAYQPKEAYRRPLADMVHYDKYDRSKYRSGEDIYRYIAELRQKTEPIYRQGL